MNRRDFAEALLVRCGLPLTEENVIALLAWQAGENTKATNNPFATTREWPRAWQFNTAKVKHYASEEDGLNATIATLWLGYYVEVRQMLEKGTSADDVVAAVARSPWGTGEAAINALKAVRADPAKYALLPAGGQNGVRYNPGSAFHPAGVVDELARRLQGG